jgi:hypothetical protein
MVTEQLMDAAGRAAAASGIPKRTLENADRGEIARLGAAAQLYAVKTKCDCPSCQALRKMADLTMAAILETSLEEVAAAPPLVSLDADPAPGEEPPNDPGPHPQPD